MTRKIQIFDTTLRDGEQSPGFSMSLGQKLRVARSLKELKVDILEAGFPAASPGDFEAVHAVASEIEGPVIAGLCRTIPRDIELTAQALEPAQNARIHTFIATSPIHRREKLKMSRAEVLRNAIDGVTMAVGLCKDVEFSAEDGIRTEREYLAEILQAVIEAGATTVNIPDTVGYNLPHQFGHLIAQLIERVPNSDKAVFSVHCHNDLGLAVSNSLSSVINGARQVECTINGLGERAGNAALEEIVMAVSTRKDVFSCNVDHIDRTQIVPTSRLVSGITGFPVQPNKAIVGVNAFAHESGIHQDGVLKSRETYEIMRAEDVGWSKNRMVLGKHSGRNAFKTRLQELGISVESEEELNSAFGRFKELADKKHEIFDDDLQALATTADLDKENEHVKLVSLKVCSETGETPVAAITLNVDGEEKQVEASGGGPVDASFQAIEKAIDSGAHLLLYSVNNITSGTDAQGEVTVRLEKGDEIVNGQGADTDIVIASAMAYVNALNKLMTRMERRHPQV